MIDIVYILLSIIIAALAGLFIGSHKQEEIVEKEKGREVVKANEAALKVMNESDDKIRKDMQDEFK